MLFLKLTLLLRCFMLVAATRPRGLSIVLILMMMLRMAMVMIFSSIGMAMVNSIFPARQDCVDYKNGIW